MGARGQGISLGQADEMQSQGASWVQKGFSDFGSDLCDSDAGATSKASEAETILLFCGLQEGF